MAVVTCTLLGEVAEAFPETAIGFVVGDGLRNSDGWDDADARLRELEEQVGSGRWQPFDETHPRISSWYDTYRRFGTNPRRLRPSVDALGRRLARSGRLPRINGAVDAYNSVSVRYGIPAGAFDLHRIGGLVEIRFARPGDRFTPLGEPDGTERPGTGEVVYAQGNQVLTRHWNHRDCDQAKVTTESTSVVFVIERVSAAAVPDSVLAEAQQELAELVRPHATTIVLSNIGPGALTTSLEIATSELT
ncbi:MAG: hypothetical protein AUG49_19820 [Catenulispora sp. 13_1_20CM_3_70_7]|nr:MAG: hypothetical protein AUG49_19820 [Catenulispora sp. 13_1_20CM_3_70_7]